MKIYDFGRLSDGRRAGLYILTNSNGMTASVTDYGATLVSLYVPDSTGVRRDVVLGHDDVKGYEVGRGTIGASVGRFANRIAGARFTIGARSFVLTANHGPNALHGGRDFYSKRMWTARIPFAKISARDIMAGITESMNDGAAMRPGGSIGGDSITFCLDSPDGDQGFPGNLHVEVTYTLTDENELHIDYLARTDRDTALNLANHSYFNLGGHDSGSVLEHEVRINAGAFTPNDKWSLPTG